MNVLSCSACASGFSLYEPSLSTSPLYTNIICPSWRAQHVLMLYYTWTWPVFEWGRWTMKEAEWKNNSERQKMRQCSSTVLNLTAPTRCITMEAKEPLKIHVNKKTITLKMTEMEDLELSFITSKYHILKKHFSNHFWKPRSVKSKQQENNFHLKVRSHWLLFG